MKSILYKIRNFARNVDAGKVFMLLGMILIFLVALRPPIDPDMGWHLKDGEYLIDHNFKVAKRDIFSYTMPDFPLVMHEWVTDIIMYLVYDTAGLFALSIFFAIVTAAAFLLASFGVEARREYKIIAAILAIIASIPILGVRPQMINLLGLALVIFIIFRFRANPKSKIIYWFPLILAVWVNLHGGFAVGLFFIALFLAIGVVEHFLALILLNCDRNFLLAIRKRIVSDLLPFDSLAKLGVFFFLSVLATLVNPYGWRVYVEVFTTVFDKYAKEYIGEWTAVTFSNPMSYQFITYLILLAILLLFSFRRIDFTYLAIAVVFLFLALSSWRHIPLFLIVSIPLWVVIVESLVGRELLNITRKKWFLILISAAIIITVKQQFQKVIPPSFSIEKLAEQGNFPYGAVAYLKANPIEGRMFNEYNWGGFLIWQYPEKKVFIDGRMPSWRIGHYKAFEEFNEITEFGEGWGEILNSYGVKFALKWCRITIVQLYSLEDGKIYEFLNLK